MALGAVNKLLMLYCVLALKTSGRLLHCELVLGTLGTLKHVLDATQ